MSEARDQTPARPDPTVVHGERLAALDRERQGLERQESRIVNLRLITFLLSVAVGVAGFLSGALSPAWAAVPAAAFLALVVAHGRIGAALVRVDAARGMHDDALARIEERWAGRGRRGLRFVPAEHVYAVDLDLFGAGSLFERLDTARTPAGEARLASWLLEPARGAVARERQQAVRELAPRVDLRERLVVLGERVAEDVDPEELGAWGRAPASPLPGWLSAVAAVASAVTAATLVLWPLAGLGPWPFVAAALVQAALLRAFRAPVREVIARAESIERELPLTARVLEALEGEAFEAPALVALQRRLSEGGRPASQRIARLASRIELLGQRRNQYFAPVAALLGWGTQLAISIERWRAESGSRLPGWLDALGEIEALAALGGYAFESPADAFPEIVDGEALFDAEALGHPLIPRARAVTNDVAMSAGAMRLHVVSGSNMSGKSTLLRAVGTAAVLALAGAPVRAARLRIAPMAIGALIDVHDSLSEGRSRFMAEIVRLKAIVESAAGDRPLLFLLDELFGGTNSRDRRIGAEAVLSSLVEQRAIGLVTTHDLALTEIVDRLGGHAANVHFEDRFEKDGLAFDYRLRPGVVERSNALELMRSIGLVSGEARSPRSAPRAGPAGDA